MGEDRRQLGRVFDEVPGLHNRVRPTYPDELFADLGAITGLTAGSSVLEVGCGTGFADLLRSTSLYRKLDRDTCVLFLDAIAERIRTRLGDRASRRYLTVLRVGPRADPSDDWQPVRASLR